jgi:hypothetical protein
MIDDQRTRGLVGASAPYNHPDLAQGFPGINTFGLAGRDTCTTIIWLELKWAGPGIQRVLIASDNSMMAVHKGAAKCSG